MQERRYWLASMVKSVNIQPCSGELAKPYAGTSIVVGQYDKVCEYLTLFE